MTSSGARPDTPPVPAEDPPSRGGRFGRRRRVWLTGLIALVVLVGGGSMPPPATRRRRRSTRRRSARSHPASSRRRSRTSSRHPHRLRSPTSRSCPRSSRSRPSVPPTSADASGLGAGVIINANGSIMTALHVVEGATNIRVSFVDGTRGHGHDRLDRPEERHRRAPARPGPETIVPAVLGGGGQVGDVDVSPSGIRSASPAR